MNKVLRIWFTDFWPYFNPNNNYFINLLRKYYEVILDDRNPEYLFFSVFGFEHLNFISAIRIQYIGENLRPNFWESYFSLSFDYEDYRFRNFRLPLYIMYGGIRSLVAKK